MEVRLVRGVFHEEGRREETSQTVITVILNFHIQRRQSWRGIFTRSTSPIGVILEHKDVGEPDIEEEEEASFNDT